MSSNQLPLTRFSILRTAKSCKELHRDSMEANKVVFYQKLLHLHQKKKWHIIVIRRSTA